MQEFFQTSYTAIAGKTQQENILGVGTHQYCVSTEYFHHSLLLLEFLLEAKNKEQIQNFLHNNCINPHIFQELKEHKLITSSWKIIPEEKNHLYLDLLVDPLDVTVENFHKTVFIIMGCGGIGNFLSYAIASYSPHKIILIDRDNISESNLNRQFMFSKDSLNLPKTEILTTELQKRFRVNIESFYEFTTTELLENIVANHSSYNILGIVSGDDHHILEITAKVFCKAKVPFLNVGYLNDISLIGPFYIPNISCCPFCHNSFSLEQTHLEDPKIQAIMDRINNRAQAPSSFINNALALAMSDIIQYMAHQLENIKSINCRFGMDNNTFEPCTLASSLDANCAYCQHAS
ncbi:ThiF family adenylyltransferase [Helicobacter mustelae]|uniref:Putative thiF family protein n=1 Tax=Helicobacter mustelae (strain ATCC 43772 / CCUG 25715 / CIP 103759 / LMG 18044 / NCTC 12198 / R85-136P) TaxID=679897 RepID=D3UIA5_HELM1|nr:ThiF family adenylyltransferase [Helicobacter mustelae]CBG40228.1 putative thiF family protein [Helicobacter mustelae 12198]SQH71727.1 thiF family protein [Helicobacter mustelae]